MGIASLVLGIVSFVCVLILTLTPIPVVALVFAVPGIVFGAIARKKNKAAGISDGIAVAGLVVSIVSAGIITVISLSCYGCMYCAHKISEKADKEAKQQIEKDDSDDDDAVLDKDKEIERITKKIFETDDVSSNNKKEMKPDFR
jgi:Predicted membrane protein (DUF2232)